MFDCIVEIRGRDVFDGLFVCREYGCEYPSVIFVVSK